MKLFLIAACLAASLGQAQLSVTGQWSPVRPMPIVAIHQTYLATGKVLMWGRGDLGDYAMLWNPTTDTYQSVDSEGTDIFCSGHTTLSDGTVLVAGGHIQDGWGRQDVFAFDPFTEIDRAWRRRPDMAEARWYPSCTTLPDGRVLILAGTIKRTPDNVWATHPEVFDPETGALEPLAKETLLSVYYPAMHVIPSGRVFFSSPSQTVTRSFNPATGTFNSFGSPSTFYGGSSVSFRPGWVLKSGGQTSPTDFSASKFAGVADVTGSAAVWTNISPMNFARREHDLTVLPDGKVLCTGGSRTFDKPETAVLPAEMFDPANNSWTTLPSMVTPRSYHSTALLLSDGRVVVAGGGNGGGRRQGASQDYMSCEIYSPGYLFRGQRPTVSGIPKVAAYGDTFNLTVDQLGDVDQVCLISPGSVTHGIDMNQRYVPLSFAKVNGKLQVQAPASGNLAPPGPYMLFVLNATGVPSVGQFVFVSERLAPLVPTAFSSTVASSGGLGSLITSDNVRWQAKPGSGANTVLYIKSMSPRSFIGTIQAQIESSGSPFRYTLDAYNYDDLRWERMASGVETASDTVKTATLVGYACRFVDPDTKGVQFRMTWETAGKPGPLPQVDKVQWRLTR